MINGPRKRKTLTHTLYDPQMTACSEGKGGLGKEAGSSTHSLTGLEWGVDFILSAAEGRVGVSSRCMMRTVLHCKKVTCAGVLSIYLKWDGWDGHCQLKVEGVLNWPRWRPDRAFKLCLGDWIETMTHQSIAGQLGSLLIGFPTSSTPVDSHYHSRVKHSVSWYFLSAQALWFYLSFSFQPAFHRYARVPCSCLHSEMVFLGSSKLFHSGHSGSQQVCHRMEDAP